MPMRRPTGVAASDVGCGPCAQKRAVYFLTHYSRGKAAAKALLGDFKGILITDRHGGYNDYAKGQRQCCLAHVQRNLEKMAQRRGQAGELGQRLTRMLRLLIRLEHRWRKENYTSRVYRQRLERLRQGFRDALVKGMQNHPKTRTGNANACCRTNRCFGPFCNILGSLWRTIRQSAPFGLM